MLRSVNYSCTPDARVAASPTEGDFDAGHSELLTTDPRTYEPNGGLVVLFAANELAWAEIN